MATLIIHAWESECGDCHKSAKMSEEGHYTLLGYGPTNGDPGCGAIFWDMAAGHPDIDDATLKACRPDLPIVKYRNPYVAPELYED